MVVVQPSCSIVGQLPEDARIYRMDQLVTKIRSTDPSALDLWKLVSPETIHLLAVDLVGHHKPSPRVVAALTMATPAPAHSNLEKAAQKCQGCGGPLTTAEAKFCRINSARFAGEMLCRKCQGYAPKHEHPRANRASAQDRSSD